VVNTLPALVKRVRSVSTLELERLRKTGAFRSIRQEWNNQRNEGQRQKKAREAAEKNN
jgi:ribosomal protein S13